jgi:predicted nucleic acid-binding protein
LQFGASDAAHARLRGEELAAPELLDLPIQRAPHLPLLSRCWELRENLTICDAAYVALAELLQADLLTADSRLAAALGPRCGIEVLQPGR